MTLPIPPRVALEIQGFARRLYGVERVTLLLADGAQVDNVAVDRNRGIVKIGDTRVSSIEQLGFRLTDIVDAQRYVGPWPALTRSRFTAVMVACGMLGATPGLLSGYVLGGAGGLGGFAAMTLIALIISAQFFYRAARRRLRDGYSPWLPCMSVIVVAYLCFGLLWLPHDGVNVNAAFDGSITAFTIISYLGTCLFLFYAALILTGWLALPLSAFVASRLAASHNRLHGGLQRGSSPGARGIK